MRDATTALLCIAKHNKDAKAAHKAACPEAVAPAAASAGLQRWMQDHSELLPVAYLNRGKARGQLGDYKSALEDLGEAVKYATALGLFGTLRETHEGLKACMAKIQAAQGRCGCACW